MSAVKDMVELWIAQASVYWSLELAANTSLR